MEISYNEQVILEQFVYVLVLDNFLFSSLHQMTSLHLASENGHVETIKNIVGQGIIQVHNGVSITLF